MAPWAIAGLLTLSVLAPLLAGMIIEALLAVDGDKGLGGPSCGRSGGCCRSR